MAALNVSSPTGLGSDSADDDSPTSAENVPDWTDSIKSALATLLEAVDFSRDLDKDPWEFAVENSCLRRLGLSNSGLRWLVARGLAEHGVEITSDRDRDRAFRRPVHLVMNRRTCFVLTPAGEAAARKLSPPKPPPHTAADTHLPQAIEHATLHADGRIASPAPTPASPAWDRNRLQLRVGHVVVFHFKVPAPDQEQILAAFEEKGWPLRIENPLAATNSAVATDRLQRAVASLNRQAKPPVVRFVIDGRGDGICWEADEARRPTIGA